MNKILIEGGYITLPKKVINEDLIPHGNYYYDLSTSNYSFIKMAKILKDLKVKNNMFMLKLYDPRLVGVNPNDPNLSDREKVLVLEECRKNYWYFIREVITIPVSGGMRSYSIHRGNLALSWALLNNINVFLVLPRQNFKTMSTCCFYLWIYLFATVNSEVSLLHKDFSGSKANLKRIKDLRDSLPEYLRINNKLDNNNVEYLFSGANKNRITAIGSAISISQADRLLRGASSSMVYFDEFAFLKFNDTVFSASAPAQSESALSAKQNGKPYHKLITTTPGFLNDPSGLYARQFIDNAIPFTEKLYSYNEREIQQYLDSGRNNFLYIYYSWKQIGRDQSWYRQQCRDLNNDSLAIKREIDCLWIRQGELAVFENSLVNRAREACTEPIGSITLCDNVGWQLNLYKHFDFNNPMLIGVDVASGESGDSSAIVVCDSSTLEVLAVFANNMIDSISLAEVCHYIMSKLFRSAVLIPERNNEGKAMINYLLKTEIGNRIYWETKEVSGQQRVLKKDGINANTVSKIKTKIYGVDTTSKSRPMMIDLIRPFLEDEYDQLHCLALVDEIAGLERKKNGKIEHSETTHDDILFAYLLCRFVWVYGTNLSKWAITKPRVFTNMKNPNLTYDELQDNIDDVVTLNQFIDYDLSEENFSNGGSINGNGISAREIIAEYMASKYHFNQSENDYRETQNKVIQSRSPDREITTTGIDWDNPDAKKKYSKKIVTAKPYYNEYETEDETIDWSIK